MHPNKYIKPTKPLYCTANWDCRLRQQAHKTQLNASTWQFDFGNAAIQFICAPQRLSFMACSTKQRHTNIFTNTLRSLTHLWHCLHPCSGIPLLEHCVQTQHEFHRFARAPSTAPLQLLLRWLGIGQRFTVAHKIQIDVVTVRTAIAVAHIRRGSGRRHSRIAGIQLWQTTYSKER